MYKCGICGREYENIEDRITCETKCLRDRKIAEEKRQRMKLEQEKDTRKKEIEQKMNELRDLMKAYTKDYGALQFGDAACFEDGFPALSKIMGWWY